MTALSKHSSLPGWCLLATFFRAARSDCLVGDVMYAENQSIGYIGAACTDTSTFNATESFCRNGTVVDEFFTGKCSGNDPYCVQTADGTGGGGAICLDKPIPERDCLVGDTMYREDQSIGIVGVACTGISTFNGTEGFCRNGVVADEFYEGECSGTTPYCAHPAGGAVCLDAPQGSSDCNQQVGPLKGPCSTVKCEAPPVGCSQALRYVAGPNQTCCHQQCYFVGHDGSPCDAGIVVSRAAEHSWMASLAVVLRLVTVHSFYRKI
eukprot:gnl/TRDRNA2_/TRDRNA2_164731_c0_seq3.p1 gnl/TRDRNA2_/TRDRNA2_164731_c0~~gnl/TRDRNA2_/TRDRNA2_164731_c0_seq3.p1  ORF type:complete len:265 (-),score=23.67 gnl/TRDRNA2_/TRDRNA2_164731_c0_seq3:16-810(-)